MTRRTTPLALAGAISALFSVLAAPALAGAATTTYAIGKGSGEVAYDMAHPMHKVHGVSRAMAGEVSVAGGHLVLPATFVLPLVTFDSGNASRDSNAAMTLDVSRFPRATLAITGFKEASNVVADGARRIAGEASGRLEVHGVAHAVRMPVSAVVTPGQLTVDAAFPLSLTEYQIPRPSLLFRPVDDEVKVTVHAVGQAR